MTLPIDWTESKLVHEVIEPLFEQVLKFGQMARIASPHHYHLIVATERSAQIIHQGDNTRTGDEFLPKFT